MEVQMTDAMDPDASDLRLSVLARLAIRLTNLVHTRAQTREEIKTARSHPEED
jgi:hypothetical protein